METASRTKARFGLLLAGLSAVFLLVLFQLLRHPQTALLLVALPGPAALVCNIRCLGVGPFLQVLGEGGKALLLIAISGSFVYALLRTARRVTRTWDLIERARRLAIPPESLPPCPGLDRVTVFEGRPPLAFTAGFFRPRVFVSRGLAESLGGDELRAVLRHESRHQASKDPLKGLLVSFVSDFLFFLPVSRLLRNTYHLAEEMTADAGAIGDPAEADALTASLLKVRQLGGAGASFLFDPTLERVKSLRGKHPGISLPLRKLALAAVFAAVSAFIVLAPVRKGVAAMFLDHDKVCVLNASHR